MAPKAEGYTHWTRSLPLPYTNYHEAVRVRGPGYNPDRPVTDASEVNMARNSSPVLITALVLTAAIWSAAQETPTVRAPRSGGRRVPGSDQQTNGNDARKVADRAIAELVAWKTTKAKQILNEAREQYGETPEFKAAEGLLRFNENKLQDAVDLLQAASAAAPADPTAEYFKGEVLLSQKKPDAARAAWTTSRDRAKALTTAQPKNAHAQYFLGAALIRHEQPAPARTALVVAAQEGFDRRMTGYQTGLSRILEKQWNQAVDALSAVIALDDRFAPAYFYRGLAWSKLNRKDLMIDDLTRFLALAPSAPESDTARALTAAFAG